MLTDFQTTRSRRATSAAHASACPSIALATRLVSDCSAENCRPSGMRTTLGRACGRSARSASCPHRCPRPSPDTPVLVELRRRLGLADAITIGAGSMIGAGVFTAWAPAADAAGRALLIGLVIAAAVAFCNATSSAQLAALHPESGGTYVYARYRLGPAWGHLAGWGFVVGKTASCAAMALAVGAYVWPAHQRLAAVLAVLLITAVNLGGLERTAFVTRWLLGVLVAGARRRRCRRMEQRRHVARQPHTARRRAARHPALGRVPVLRLRRLRPDRDARRGGRRSRR